MAKASIHFEDDAEGVMVALNFDDELPEDPAEASEAQIQAMWFFQQVLDLVQEGSPNGEPDFEPEV